VGLRCGPAGARGLGNGGARRGRGIARLAGRLRPKAGDTPGAGKALAPEGRGALQGPRVSRPLAVGRQRDIQPPKQSGGGHRIADSDPTARRSSSVDHGETRAGLCGGQRLEDGGIVIVADAGAVAPRRYGPPWPRTCHI
jgi:hypothetical protein